MENSEYLATDPLAALNLQPMALQGGGGTFNNSDPMANMAMQMGMKAAGTMMARRDGNAMRTNKRTSLWSLPVKSRKPVKQ